MRKTSICLRVLVVMLAVAAPARAQQARTAGIAVDTVVAYDAAIDQNGDAVPGVVMDAVVLAGLGHGLEAIVRPFAQRLGSTREWNRQIWLATLRYEHSGRVGLRIDGGLIPPPVGFANMFLRSPLNPTIAMPSSLFQPLPAIEPRGTRTTLLGALYPYGVSATVSGTAWDGRAAVIDGSPLRPRRIFAATNPPQFANLVLGGGLTPIVGLRIGGSVTHGGWRRSSEIPLSELARVAAEEAGDQGSSSTGIDASRGGDVPATVVTLESEYARRYTKFAGEWTRNRVETGTGYTLISSGWFVQGVQTLTPRWFAAARVERLAAPAMTTPGTFVRQRFNGLEETLGYRLTPEVTVRASHRAREVFGRDTFGHTATVSLVWWKRWK